MINHLNGFLPFPLQRYYKKFEVQNKLTKKMHYARINECFWKFSWSSLYRANVYSRWDGAAVSVSSKVLLIFETHKEFDEKMKKN